jgi:hypothetical protein
MSQSVSDTCTVNIILAHKAKESKNILRGGRPKDPIWEHFLQVDEGNMSFAKCKTCNKQQSVEVYRNKQRSVLKGLQCSGSKESAPAVNPGTGIKQYQAPDAR